MCHRLKRRAGALVGGLLIWGIMEWAAQGEPVRTVGLVITRSARAPKARPYVAPALPVIEPEMIETPAEPAHGGAPKTRRSKRQA